MDARSVLLEARLAAGITQRELARRSGVPQAAISRTERGLASPRADTLDRLLRACGRDLQVIVRPGTGVDRTLIAERLRLSAGQRARLAVRESANVRRLLDRARRS